MLPFYLRDSPVAFSHFFLCANDRILSQWNKPSSSPVTRRQDVFSHLIHKISDVLMCDTSIAQLGGLLCLHQNRTVL